MQNLYLLLYLVALQLTDLSLEPQPTQAEKDQVVAELKAIAPQGTEIVDPYDVRVSYSHVFS
jgi:hypothetical protein